MVSNISKVTTKEEVIELLHPELKTKIPAEKLDTIAQNILEVENYFKGFQHLKPGDVKATRIYDYGSNRIQQIDYEGITYKIT